MKNFTSMAKVKKKKVIAILIQSKENASLITKLPSIHRLSSKNSRAAAAAAAVKT